MKTNTVLLTTAMFIAGVLNSIGQPSITTQPTNQVVYVSTPASFSVTATGTPPMAFQWRSNGADLFAKTNSSLSLVNAQFTNAGPYSVLVTNDSGSVTSQMAWLSVLPTNVVNLGDMELRFGQPTSPRVGPVWVCPRSDDAHPTMTGDGLTVFFDSTAPGGSGGYDIWMVTRPTLSSAWGSPINLGPTVNSTGEDGRARLSSDSLSNSLSLYFDSTRLGGRGGWDIWVATRQSPTDPFGTPTNLGPAVNSSADDGAPCISADGRTLVFRSDRAGGLGSFDMWITTRTNAQAPWEPALNLGAPLNTSGLEFPACLSADGLLLFIKAPDRVPRSGIFVSKRASRAAPFGAPVLIQPILSLGDHGADFCSLSADSATLYVNTFLVQEFDWSRLVAVSVMGLPQLTVLGMNGAGEFQFGLLGREGATYEIEVSNDLNSWSPWLTTNNSGNLLLSDPSAASKSRRIYRALSH